MANPPRIGYLGPKGTFTEQALLDHLGDSAAEIVARQSMSDVLFATAEGELDLGFVAIENAIEGTVNVTVDTLAFDVDLLIQQEVVIDISMNLLASANTALEDIERVLSFGHAAAQCRGWLREHLPNVEVERVRSTAEAAEIVARANGEGNVAAIANRRAAEIYGLKILGTDIEDHPENATRFVVVARAGIPAATGHDKTSLVVYQKADKPGSLLSILQEFAARNINLTLLLSRPTREVLGDYCFLLELEGHISDEVVADCLLQLKAKQGDVKFLGSYPAAGVSAPESRAEFASRYEEASAWMNGLRDQLSSI